MKCKKHEWKVSVSDYKSKNGVVLGWSSLRFLSIRVGKIGAILGQSEAIVKTKKYSEFLC